jgi:putative ABC transport system permease protein
MGKLAWRNLLRNKRRSFLTMGSVAVTLVLLCLLLAILDAMERAEGSSDNRVVVRSAISLTFNLPESYWQRLETVAHVEAVTPLDWFGGTYIDNRPENFFPQFACDPATQLDVFPEYQIPAEQLKTWQAERNAFLAGKSLAEKHGWKIGDQIFLQGTIYPVDLELTLRGIFTVPNAPAQEKSIYFHRKYFQEALGNPGTTGSYWLRVRSPEDVPAVIAQTEAMFQNSDAQVRAETEKAFQLSFLEMLGNIRLFLGVIGLAVIISLLFITANTMAMAARERTTEVAVLKTLGFGRFQVVAMVLLESLAVGVLGSLAGLGLATLLLRTVATAMEDVFPIFGTLRMSGDVLLVGLALGIAIGLVSGWFPAFQAARLKIADGLRRVA